MEKNLPIVRKLCDLEDIFFPPNGVLEERETQKIENAIMEGGIISETGSLYFAKRKIQPILATDRKGVNKLYNDSQECDKLEIGSEQYLAHSQIKKNIDERLQQPRNILEQEKLKHSEKCLDVVRDSPTLVKERSIKEERINQARPTLTKKMMKEEERRVCELSGEIFEDDAQAHHILRVADNPERALDPSNMIVVKGKIHRDIHATNSEGEEGLKNYAKKNNYTIPNRLKNL